MTLEELMALKRGDRYFRLYDDGDVLHFEIGEFTLDQRDRDKLSAAWRSWRFITRAEAEDAAEMINIHRALTR